MGNNYPRVVEALAAGILFGVLFAFVGLTGAVPMGYFVLLDEIYLLGGSAGRAADFAARQTRETAQNMKSMDWLTCALRIGIRSEIRL